MPRPPTVLSDPDLRARAVAQAKQGRRRDYIARIVNLSCETLRIWVAQTQGIRGHRP